MYRKLVLDNGVRVVTERMPTLKSVTVGVWVNTGSRDEQPSQAGYSHFIEHMLFKGTRIVPPPKFRAKSTRLAER